MCPLQPSRLTVSTRQVLPSSSSVASQPWHGHCCTWHSSPWHMASSRMLPSASHENWRDQEIYQLWSPRSPKRFQLLMATTCYDYGYLLSWLTILGFFIFRYETKFISMTMKVHSTELLCIKIRNETHLSRFGPRILAINLSWDRGYDLYLMTMTLIAATPYKSMTTTI